MTGRNKNGGNRMTFFASTLLSKKHRMSSTNTKKMSKQKESTSTTSMPLSLPIFGGMPEEQFCMNNISYKKMTSLTRDDLENGFKHIYDGKVKKVYQNDNYDLMLFEYTDALSCFNKYRCDVSRKGEILNTTNAWWMEETKHIVKNHYIAHSKNKLLAKKCTRVDIEVVVRGFYTGSLTRDDNHLKYGLELPKGIKSGDPFPYPVITPTTKDEEDLPLTEKEIYDKGLASPAEWEEIKRVAMQLFFHGMEVMRDREFILVDTKYEFGYDKYGELTLIDEIHTGDSSRYWDAATGENLDKDHVRRFVSDNPDTKIPEEVIGKVRDAYLELYTVITGSVFPDSKEIDLYDHYIRTVPLKIIVIAGSKKDSEHVQKINQELRKNGFVYLNFFHSAHKETMKVFQIVRSYENEKVIFVTVAGLSNALGGVVASNSSKPVINCPPFKNEFDMGQNINSSIMMPSGVPSALIIRPDNLAGFLSKIESLLQV